MSLPRRFGLDTEYGFVVEGRSPEDLVDDATEIVRAYPHPAHAGWNYGWEAPRADLRGFRLDRLAFDPVDAAFDAGRVPKPAEEIRADRVLVTGGRLYNDHGHPEYATPECRTLDEVVRHDAAGIAAVLAAARAYEAATGRRVTVYRNNTDFHGASYGTHEGYLAPRALGFEGLFAAVTPMLVARPVLTGAGKVGAEAGGSATYQLSQRADFVTEAANAETLYRRPVFNTRDEPHADPARWIRLHVISGDSCMIPSGTRRKVGLVSLAVRLAAEGEVPRWRIADPVRAFQSVSRDETGRHEVALEGRSWTNADEIVESYLAAAERTLVLEGDEVALIAECRDLMTARTRDFARFARHVDWAAKRRMLETFLEELGTDWRDPALRAYDLEYHNVDPDEGLYHALAEMGGAEPPVAGTEAMLTDPLLAPDTRAAARGLAVARFPGELLAASWRSLALRSGEVELPIEMEGFDRDVSDVESFVRALGGSKP